MFYTGNWIDSFPDNFQWSNATLVTKAWRRTAPSRSARSTKSCSGCTRGATSRTRWWEEWCAHGRAHRARCRCGRGGGARRDRRQLLPARRQCTTTPASAWCSPASRRSRSIARACAADEGLKRRYPQHRARRRAVRRRVAAGLFHEVAGRIGRAPTVVLFDGLDNCKEMSVLFAGSSSRSAA